jgi:hypothetical protein
MTCGRIFRHSAFAPCHSVPYFDLLDSDQTTSLKHQSVNNGSHARSNGFI